MKSSLYASTASVVTAAFLGLTSPALAQETGTPAAADDEEAIVVTARRREELLQDVPISMTVYTPQQIADRNIVVATDLATYTPSLSVNQRFGPEKASFGIRGFNQDISTAPSVGVYFADVVGVRSQGGTTSGNTVGAGAFMDLQNVQVLKGPQGTLFGRNTTGGAVLLVPKKPTDRVEGFAELQAGNYNMMRGMAVVNIPISDGLRVRVGFDRNVREGYLRNRSGVGPDDFNDVNYFYARASIVADLSEDIENYTIFHYSNSHTHGRASRQVICADRARQLISNVINPTLFPNPNPAAPLAGSRGLTAYASCDQIARHDARGDSLLDVDVNNPDPFLRIKQWQVINTTTWKAAEWLTIKNIFSYGEFRENAAFQLYSDNFVVSTRTPNPFGPFIPIPPGTPFKYIQLDDGPNDNPNAQQRSTTEELQFQIESGNFNGVIGGYLEFSRPIGWNYSHTGVFANCVSPAELSCTNPLSIGNVSAARTRFDFDNHGIFAQGTYNFSDQFALTVGARYTFDKIHGENESTRINLTAAGAVLNVVCNDVLRFNQPDGPDNGTDPDPLVVPDFTHCHSEINTSSKRPTWLIDFDYKPTDDILLYAKYARGYRQGGINFTTVGLEVWGPEKVNTYEIGAKTSFRTGGVHGTFNFAAFYNDFSDQQIFGGTIAKMGSGLAGGAAIINAGKSTIKGFEVDASAFFFDDLRVDLGYTYLNTKVKELVPPVLPPTSPFSSVEPTAVLGGPLAFSPKHRLTVTGTYTLPLEESLGDLSVGVTWVYTSRSIADAGMPVEIGYVPKTHLFSANLNWNKMFGSPLDGAIFVTNLTDKRYSVGTGGGYISAGLGDINIGLPRMWGARLRMNFGE